jgi:hypothetical protein
MLNVTKSIKIEIQELSVDDVKKILENNKSIKSIIGHESTATLLSQLLGIKVEFNREAIMLKPGDSLIVFQLLTRLPEGKILSLEEIQQLPFKFYYIVQVDD